MLTISRDDLYLRLVEENDAEFIFFLRTHPEKSRYLCAVSSDVHAQKEWITQYKKRENQGQEYYFVACLNNNEKAGVIRIYDLQKDSFCWGSWVSAPDAPKGTGLKMLFMAYDFGFYHLGYPKSHFDVLKDNEKSVRFHKQFGAKVINEDATKLYFSVDKNEYEQGRSKYQEIWQPARIEGY